MEYDRFSGEISPGVPCGLPIVFIQFSVSNSHFDILQDFKEPKLDPQVVTKFIPALMSLMVDDQVRQLNAKLPPDERESAITIIEHSGKIL